MKIFPDFLVTSFREDSNVSSSRIMAVSTVFSTVVLPSIVWAFLSLFDGKPAEIPMTFVGFMGAANVLVCGMFVANKRRES